MLRLTLFIFLSFLTFLSRGQNNSTPAPQQSEGILYTNERSYGIMLHSAGWGLEYRNIKILNAFKRRWIGVDYTNIRDPREIKSSITNYSNSKGIFYGKLNNVYIFRPQVGYLKQIYGKEIRSAVHISYVYAFGPSLAIVKPVFLEVRVGKNQDGDDIQTQQYNPETHSRTQILSKAPFTTGIEKITINPGAFLKFGFNFDYEAEVEALKAIEVGAILDVHPWPIAMMAYQPKAYYYLNLYVQLTFGKRWY